MSQASKMEPSLNGRKPCSELLYRLFNSVLVSFIMCFRVSFGKTCREEIWVLHVFSLENRTQYSTICIAILMENVIYSILHHIGTDDEKWVLQVKRNRKDSSFSRNEKSMLAPEPRFHPQKSFLCVWRDMTCIVHYELLKHGSIITTATKIGQNKASLRQRCPTFLNRRSVIIQLVNSKVHRQNKCKKKIRSLWWQVLPHSSYTPDLTPTNCNLFPLLEHFINQ